MAQGGAVFDALHGQLDPTAPPGVPAPTGTDANAALAGDGQGLQEQVPVRSLLRADSGGPRPRAGRSGLTAACLRHSQLPSG